MPIQQPSCGRILAIEDDPVLQAHIQGHLDRLGYEVDVAGDGQSGLHLAAQGGYDVILMDIMLPRLGGLDALAQLRDSQSVPVVLMSALGAEEHRIHGFSQGADDYLPKPFSLSELQVRIEAILRRVKYERQQVAGTLAVGALTLDWTRRDALYAGRWAKLTDYEFRLLRVLLSSNGESLSKAYLYQQVLRRPFTLHDRGLDMHVSHLRRKLRAINFFEGSIETVWGIGYRYQQAGEE